MPLTIISEKLSDWLTTLIQLKQEKHYDAVATVYSNSSEP